MMAKYAENTAVPVERSKAEIEKILVRYGADQFMYAADVRKAMVMFRANNRLVRFVIPIPDVEDNELLATPTGRSRSESAIRQEYEKEVKRRWRALVLSVRGRKHVKKSNFAIPGKKKYPIHDLSHARNDRPAKSFCSMRDRDHGDDGGVV